MRFKSDAQRRAVFSNLPRKMSLTRYNDWMDNPLSRKASLPEFFVTGVPRTRRVIKGTATPDEINKWESFGARHYAQYDDNPTCRRAIALRNWAYDVPYKEVCEE